MPSYNSIVVKGDFLSGTALIKYRIYNPGTKKVHSEPMMLYGQPNIHMYLTYISVNWIALYILFYLQTYLQ